MGYYFPFERLQSRHYLSLTRVLCLYIEKRLIIGLEKIVRTTFVDFLERILGGSWCVFFFPWASEEMNEHTLGWVHLIDDARGRNEMKLVEQLGNRPTWCLIVVKVHCTGNCCWLQPFETLWQSNFWNGIPTDEDSLLLWRLVVSLIYRISW